jgi:two-component system OmpR family response regulator
MRCLGGLVVEQNFIQGNVLVVEDDVDCGQMIVRILSSAGYGVRLVNSRDAAAQALRRYLYEYIILDLRMPGMPTEKFLEIVRSSSREMHIILTTAESDAQRESERLGIPKYIGKPFSPEQLIGTIQSLASGIGKLPPLPPISDAK